MSARRFRVCLWSGGRVVETWITNKMPSPAPTGGGYRFHTDDTGLLVEVIGTISIEEGDWEYEKLGPRV